MANAVGMEQTAWSRWEKSPPAQLEILARIARHYKVSADYLLGLVDDPVPAAERNGWSTDAAAAAELMQASSAAKRREMLAVLMAMVAAELEALEAEEEQVNPLFDKLDGATQRQIERSIQIEGDVSAAKIRGVLQALQEQKKE